VLRGQRNEFSRPLISVAYTGAATSASMVFISSSITIFSEAHIVYALDLSDDESGKEKLATSHLRDYFDVYL
jgi:hypothetical protein